LWTRKCYIEHQRVSDETKTRELKSLAAALSDGRNPRQMVKDKALTYINAFLNASSSSGDDAGGALIFGVSDDGFVERVPIYGNCKSSADDDTNGHSKKYGSLEERATLARAVKDDIRKLIDEFCRNMDPPVDEDLVSTVFVPVLPVPTSSSSGRATTALDNDSSDETTVALEEEIYNVIEIHVKPGRRCLYFVDRHSFFAFERRDGSTHAMDRSAITEALSNRRQRWGGRDDDWRGGWRQISSSFDFEPLMRRLSDPWAGREWLFAAIRQALYRCVQQGTSSSLNTKYGVAITGSRGMGKTSFLSELALRPPNVTSLDVIAHHLCRPDDPDTLNPALFVQSLAAMLVRHFKPFRALMADTSSSLDGDSIGSTMLRALRKEHCESNPDDAFLRGILRPLQEIETRRSPSQKAKEKHRFPLIIVIDAIDDALGVDLETSGRRRGSSTIAHLLERGLKCEGIPPWIKIIVSFRKDICDVSGPITRLAENLNLIQLDPDLSVESSVRQAHEDIRLYIEAYIERTKMTSPLGCYVGKAKWNPAAAVRATKKLRLVRGEKLFEWQYETKPGEWLSFNEFAAIDLEYCQTTGMHEVFITEGKSAFLVNLNTSTRENVKSGQVERIRRQEIVTASPSCTNTTTKEQSELLRQEHNILDALAANSQGNYLYTRSVLEDIHSGQCLWEKVPSLPRGLDHLYHRFFCLHFGGHQTDKEVGNGNRPMIRAVKPVVEILLAATKRGITESSIAHAVVAGGACDPVGVDFCLRDIQWALDVDNSGREPRYSLRHESIRAWLKHDLNAKMFGFSEDRGHAYLAASLLQRCWPQQTALSRWLHRDGGDEHSWEPNKDDEDVFHLVTHLSKSRRGEEEEQVSLLKTIGGDNLNSVFRGRTTALHSASSAGDTDVVKLLLAAGADPHKAVRGRRPLHLAASKGFCKTAEMLINAGADATAPTTSGRTPLLIAAGRGSVSTVKCILAAIAEMESKPDFLIDLSGSSFVDMSQIDSGRTALSLACEEGYDDIIAALLDAGASASLADRWGRTPLFYGKSRCFSSLINSMKCLLTL